MVIYSFFFFLFFFFSWLFQGYENWHGPINLNGCYPHARSEWACLQQFVEKLASASNKCHITPLNMCRTKQLDLFKDFAKCESASMTSIVIWIYASKCHQMHPVLGLVHECNNPTKSETIQIKFYQQIPTFPVWPYCCCCGLLQGCQNSYKGVKAQHRLSLH